MSNEFDIEAAKRGEPVEFRDAATSTWEPVHFIGVSNTKTPVVEMHGCADVFRVSPGLLRMAPKKVKVRYRVALFKSVWSGDAYFTVSTNSDSEAEEWAGKNSAFLRWLTDWQEVEVPQ